MRRCVTPVDRTRGDRTQGHRMQGDRTRGHRGIEAVPPPERGAASIFVVGMAGVLLACAGLVADGGAAINARMRVADDAEQAARVGADSIDVDALRAGGEIRIDTGLAASRAAGYLAERQYGAGQFSVDVVGETVRVEVADSTETTFLQLIGIGSYDVSASATATPETGS